jgi:hypothetical protein
MASVTARILFTCLVVAATAAASGESPRERSDATAAEAAAPLLLATAADSASGTGANHRSKQLLLASNLTPTGIAATAPLHRHDLKSPATDSDVKEWMLIAMGLFLICAMSHRRSQSMAD